MRDPARELADGFHLLRLAEPLLEFPALRDVPGNLGKANVRAAPIIDRLDDNVGEELGAILAHAQTLGLVTPFALRFLQALDRQRHGPGLRACRTSKNAGR